MPNGKNSKGVLVMATVLGIVALIGAWFITIGKMSNRLDHAEEACDQSLENREDVIKLQKDVVHIKDKVDSIHERIMRTYP